MCAIIGSFDKVKFHRLYTLNEYRGNLSHSVAKFDENDQIIELWKSPGNLNPKVVDHGVDGLYIVGHSQAPTTDSSNIHPSGYNGSLLWHNGIVKQNEFDPNTWDTWWLLKGIETVGYKFLSTVLGSFACVLYGVEKKLYIFRNEIAPLFIDDDLNMSSTEFEGSRPIEPGKVFELNLKDRTLKEVAQFNTRENPYYFGDE